MKKIRFSQGKFASFMSSKGFYSAVAICLVGAGAATWLAVNRTINSIENSNNTILSEAGFADFPPVEEVERRVPDIPAPPAQPPAPAPSPEPSSLQPTPPSLPEPPSEPEEPSEPAEAPPPSPTLLYTLPVRGSIVNQFSNGELVKNNTLGDWRTHDGVDIAAEKGAEIFAAAAGTVTEVKRDALWGTVLTITHADGKLSIYSGLSEVMPVNTGDAVMAKQAIGKLEGVPSEMSDGTHLHFAIRDKNGWLDPLVVIGSSE